MPQVVEVPRLDLLARPWSPAQECEARLDGWIDREATDVDARGECLPAVTIYKCCEDRLERESMQWIVRLFAHVRQMRLARQGVEER